MSRPDTSRTSTLDTSERHELAQGVADALRTNARGRAFVGHALARVACSRRVCVASGAGHRAGARRRSRRGPRAGGRGCAGAAAVAVRRGAAAIGSGRGNSRCSAGRLHRRAGGDRRRHRRHDARRFRRLAVLAHARWHARAGDCSRAPRHGRRARSRRRRLRDRDARRPRPARADSRVEHGCDAGPARRRRTAAVPRARRDLGRRRRPP